MERVLWSAGVVLVWVVSMTMLTWQEFMVAGLAAFAVVGVRRALAPAFRGGRDG